MYRKLLLPLLPLLLVFAGCPPGSGDTASTPPAARPPGQGGPANGQAQPAAPIKQLILLYTGDTLSAAAPINNNDEAGSILRQGGVSALSAALLEYQRSITALTRQRILDQGGDASGIKADSTAGVLGEHPYLLLDYGGWEREEDSAGAPLVRLQLRMYDYFKYAAVGIKLYQRLDSAQWQAYGKDGYPAGLLNSAGPQRSAAPAAQRVVTRKVHGAKWGIASVPLPPKEGDPFGAIDDYVEQAAQALADAGCQYRILLCPGGPKELYQRLAKDKRFTVVIGANPPGLCASEGIAKLPADGPLLLPELEWGGQQFGACHLIYPTDGAAPTEYNFSLHKVIDDMESPYPYRKQVAEALAEHRTAPAPAGKSR
jgi:hypothetical protein